MFRNYIKTALRSLFKQKLYSFINIFGLAIGIAISIMVYLFIHHETNYDTCYEDYESIYRITGLFTDEEKEEWLAVTPYPIAHTVRDELPEVKAATKINDAWRESLFQYNDDAFYSKNFAFVDTTFFDVFSFDFISGNPVTALKQPTNIVLSKKIAQQIFGKINPIGQIITQNNKEEYKVVAVLDKPASPTHFKYDMYIPWFPKKEIPDNQWVSMFNYYTYVKVHDGVDPQRFENKMNTLIQSKLKGLLSNNGVTDFNSEDAKSFMSVKFGTQPLKDIHLYSHLDGEISPNGHVRYIYVYGLVALIMLIIACINFMNIATARSSKRAKEVGVRKVVGASRWNTSFQFLTEALVQSFVALLLAFILAEVFLPIFNNILGIQLSVFQVGIYKIIGIAILFTFFTGLLAGSYPALFLSGFQPIKVLKGDFSKSKESAPLRKGLVIFQFMICSALILFLFIVANQINFMATKDLGFHPEQVIVVPVQTSTLSKNFEPLRNQLLQIPEVKKVSQTLRVPGEPMGGNMYQVGDKQALWDFNRVDQHYLDVLDIPLKAGRFFTKSDFNDTLEYYVVNESFVKYYNIENDPVGQVISGGNGDGPIIGVFQDHHYKGFDYAIQPHVLQEFRAWGTKAAIKVSAENVGQTIQKIKREWSVFEPSHPMRFTFLNESFGTLYKNYENFGKALSFITLLIIFTAILGLFGLAAFMAEQRTKEIGIRKVLGATVNQIMYLMVKDFIRLVIIASIIAIPVGYWISQKWLEEFAYRVDFTILPVMGSIAFIIFIALATVSYQAFRASAKNPVKAIKYE